MENFTQAGDTQLIHLFQEGNNHALETLVNRYKDKIFTSINFLVKDKFLAEDIFQDVFIKIIDTLRRKGYNEEGKFLPWAMRIAHNMCVDHFRKVKRATAVTTTDDRAIFEVVNVDDSADHAMLTGQKHENVRRLLNLLPEEQREVIVLRNYADLSFKEIAQMSNCSINTALGRMRYGLINMRKMMHEKQLAL